MKRKFSNSHIVDRTLFLILLLLLLHIWVNLNIILWYLILHHYDPVLVHTVAYYWPLYFCCHAGQPWAYKNAWQLTKTLIIITRVRGKLRACKFFRSNKSIILLQCMDKFSLDAWHIFFLINTYYYICSVTSNIKIVYLRLSLPCLFIVISDTSS